MPSNNYCKHPRIPLAVLGASLCLPSLWAQGNQYLTTDAPPKLVVKRGAAAEAKIAVSVQPGFHVNSNTPSDAYLIPLKLTWTPGGALEPGAVVFPKPQMEKYEFSDKPLSVFTGDFDLIAKFKVPAGASQGPESCSANCATKPATITPASRRKRWRCGFRIRCNSAPICPSDLRAIRTVFEIDDRITAPKFGFSGAEHYYRTQSANQFLERIRVPTLFITAQDDPLSRSGSTITRPSAKTPACNCSRPFTAGIWASSPRGAPGCGWITP